MDVSQFELIWKPQSPAAPPGGQVDNLIQGYFLQITNLETVTLRYQVDFVAAPATDPLRSLAGNTVVFVDTPNGNNQAGILNGTLTSTVFTPSTGLITIPPNGTALIAVLPQAFGPAPNDPVPLPGPQFEVRGHVRLRLPALLQTSQGGGLPFIRFVPQASAPVKVLLTPQNRTTYFTAAGAISDQTQATLPLASGAGLNLITPESGRFFAAELAVDLSAVSFAERMAAMPPDMEMLPLMLAALESDADAVGSLNKAMAGLGVGLAVERRKIKG
jgi:hypothetical protein